MKTEMTRKHITIPVAYLTLFEEYIAEHPQFSLSSFMTSAGIEKVTRARGRWLDRIKQIEDSARSPITKEEFAGMSIKEKWEVVRRLQG